MRDRPEGLEEKKTSEMTVENSMQNVFKLKILLLPPFLQSLSPPLPPLPPFSSTPSPPLLPPLLLLKNESYFFDPLLTA